MSRSRQKYSNLQPNVQGLSLIDRLPQSGFIGRIGQFQVNAQVGQIQGFQPLDLLRRERLAVTCHSQTDPGQGRCCLIQRKRDGGIRR